MYDASNDFTEQDEAAWKYRELVQQEVNEGQQRIDDYEFKSGLVSALKAIGIFIAFIIISSIAIIVAAHI